MIPTKLNKQQHEAVLNGVTKLWFPMNLDLEHRKPENNGGINMLYPDYVDALVTSYSPLQPNEQYFVQEEFIDDPSHTVYKADFSQSNQDLEDWQSANRMTEDQSRIKFIAADVEVRCVQKLNFSSIRSLGVTHDESIVQSEDDVGDQCYSRQCSLTDNFVEWHDSQYPDTPYNTKPTGFLVSIERISHETINNNITT